MAHLKPSGPDATFTISTKTVVESLGDTQATLALVEPKRSPQEREEANPGSLPRGPKGLVGAQHPYKDCVVRLLQSAPITRSLPPATCVKTTKKLFKVIKI